MGKGEGTRWIRLCVKGSDRRQTKSGVHFFYAYRFRCFFQSLTPLELDSSEAVRPKNDIWDFTYFSFNCLCAPTWSLENSSGQSQGS